MNWMHRKRRVGWRYYLRSEMNNKLLAYIRNHMADSIIYQSEFARCWWQTVHRMTSAASKIVYNGVDLDLFSPDGPGSPPADHLRLLLVEAHVSGGYEKGLESAIHLTQMLGQKVSQPVELMVVGQVDEQLRDYWTAQSQIWITWKGVVTREAIPEIDRSAHILFSSDLNAACPNSVIEALACGLPVISYATGSLPELVDENAGRVVPYGSNYWNLEAPDVESLANAAMDILNDLSSFRLGARKKAVSVFSVEDMVDGYLDQLMVD